MSVREIGELMGIGVEEDGGVASDYALPELRKPASPVLPASAESWAERPSAYLHAGLEAARRAALRGEETPAALPRESLSWDQRPSAFLDPGLEAARLLGVLNSAVDLAESVYHRRDLNAAPPSQRLSNYALPQLNDLFFLNLPC